MGGRSGGSGDGAVAGKGPAGTGGVSSLLGEGAVAEWATLSLTRSAQVPVAGQLRVTADEAVVFSFLSAGPGLPRIAENNAECGVAHLFSAACVNQASERVREESERDRSVYVGALAVMLGSPHGRLYYTTALLMPQRLNGHAATMSHGLGTGYSNLPRTNG